MSRPAITALPHDILLRICGLLLRTDKDAWNKPRRQPSLAALAVTCAILSEPALDVLWATLGSLVPLVAHTLPGDLCAIAPLPAEINCHSHLVEYLVLLHREPVTEDFRRFSTYASRVKTFNVEDWADAQLFSNYEIPSNVLVNLLQHGPQPLLPNLRSLWYPEIHWYNHYEPGVSGRGLLYRSEPFFGPRLKEVTVEFGDWPSDEPRPTEVVRSLSYRSPSVESITMYQIGVFYPKHNLSKSARLVGSAIGALVHLVKFESRMVFISPAALLALGSLPKLQELVVHVDPTEYLWDALPHGTHSDRFPALKDLTLIKVPLEWCVAFMDVVSSSSLWRVCLNYEDPDPTALPGMLLEAFCMSIANHPSSTTIRELSFVIGWGEHTTPQVYRSPHISPLLSLPALQKLSVHGGSCLVIVDDAFLDAITWSWPNLQSLEIHWPNSNRIGPGELGYPEATLAGVILLARYCPRLTDLTFPIDTRDVPGLDKRRPPVPLWTSYASPLESFCPWGSAFQADDVHAFAMFLSVIFPNLRLLGFPWQDRDISSQILGLHRRYLRIRWQERRWMVANGQRSREPEPDPYSCEEGEEAESMQIDTEVWSCGPR